MNDVSFTVKRGEVFGILRPTGPAGRRLRQRELEVLGLTANGRTNREVAHLFVSEATVKTHLLHVQSKLGVKDRAAAVATAYERGLLNSGSRPS